MPRIPFAYSGLILLSFFLFLIGAAQKWIFPNIELHSIVIEGSTLFFHRKKTKKVYQINLEDIREFKLKITRDVIKEETYVNNYGISSGTFSYSIILLRKIKLLLTDELQLEISIKLNLKDKRFTVKNKPRSTNHLKSEVMTYKL